ncbi:LysR family transcriptional regulator [Deinococcus knuensis]|uniref:LysR family transcriptional regulator n=1 Tax=Deinococcus knuensis TaxID=1837380 RepID=A0ABQ2SEK0_9DEIO|nr:LysR family transcriptional regulator [Deinococcus knuensis]GGS25723.1 LysR family transcriptional regulator [Deinococcus knuensis]
MRLNPEHLITFSVVAELTSVSRAATALNLSQPAVSGQLRSLQEQFGGPLYERHGRGIRLTAGGERLLPYAQAIARNVQEASGLLDGLSARRVSTLRVGFSFALTPVVSSVIRLGQEHGLKIQAETRPAAELADEVRGGTLSAALVVTSPQRTHAGLDNHRIGEDTLRLALLSGHPLAGQGYVPPHALRGERLLWAARGSGIRLQTERILEATGISAAQGGLELGSLWAVLEGVRRGHGLGILPASFLAADVQAGRVVSLGIEAPHVTVLHTLLTAPSALLSSAARTLTDVLSRHPLRALLAEATSLPQPPGPPRLP